MKISFYLHAWQGVLMFIAGLLCVLASFGGYLVSGGGEELLRRALVNVTSGKASYDSIEMNWQAGRIEVTNIRHEDFSWPKEHPVATLSKLSAPHYVQFEGWPARIAGITVDGMTGATVNLTEGFLQEGKLPDQSPAAGLPRIQFVNCNLNISLGKTAPLKLDGCRGELYRDSDGKLRGGFSLRELNGKPFEFNLEALDGGRWAVSSGRILLDTSATLRETKNPFASKVDPVGLLVQALFSGEMGAVGTINALRVSVQPATERVPFSCDGEIGYSNLSLKLPTATQKSADALPFFMGLLLGADEKDGSNLWPRWMQVDQITTGEKGRLAFHMADGRLDFNCDEGPGSALSGVRGEWKFPPLESLKGSVEADTAGSPRRVLLRGFLGSQLSFETRVDRDANSMRTYELWLQPRPGDSARLDFQRPLWRFQSRVKDYYSVRNRPSDLPLAEFELEGSGRNFPLKDGLPSGLTDLAGRLTAKGGLYNLNANPKDGLLLRFEQLRLDDGAKINFAQIAAKNKRVHSPDNDAFSEAFYALFASEKPWTLYDLDIQGEALARFSPELRLQSVQFSRWSAHSGALSYRGLMTDFALPELRFSGEYTQAPNVGDRAGDRSTLFALKGSDWSAELSGKWVYAPGKNANGAFEFRESSIPLKLHPQREELSKTPAGAAGSVSRLSNVVVTPEGAKVERKGP